MSGKITTHVLNAAEGCPAAGVEIEYYRMGECLGKTKTNEDGRTDAPLLSDDAVVVGGYEIRFKVGPYFADRDLETASPPYLDTVPICFNVADAEAHYHVALLVTPWSYTTYRGS
jgi:5-hydroxyisourate hydrolase